MTTKTPTRTTVATSSVATVTCTLRQPHTHQGRELPPGSQIDLPLAQAQWLHSLGVIDAPAIPADPSPATVKE